MNQVSTINVLKVEDKIMVSSKEVAEKFGKRHDNVLRDIESLQVPDNFRLLNFEEVLEKDSQDIDRPVVYMTRDGFTILAFGFTGKKALQWKLGFLEAFNKMEHTIIEQLPALREEVESLRRNNFELTQKIMMLPAPKKEHGNKNTVIVPVAVNTLFGTEIEYKRVPKGSDRFSEMTYKEGEFKRLSNVMTGMMNKINRLSHELSRLRRM
jgi:Rha family phage regulatory protein